MLALKPTSYSFSTPFTGNSGDALDVARIALLSLGFELLKDADEELEASGPGMHSNQQPDLLGATHIHFKVNESDINVNATLGGVDKMKKFILYFPPGLLASLWLMGFVLGDPMPAAVLLLVIPWIFIANFIGKTFEKTTSNAIEPSSGAT